MEICTFDVNIPCLCDLIFSTSGNQYYIHITISTSISDLHCSTTQSNKEAIEQNKGSKVFARDLPIGQGYPIKAKTDDGGIASQKSQLLNEVEQIYTRLLGNSWKRTDILLVEYTAAGTPQYRQVFFKVVPLSIYWILATQFQ